MSDHRIQKNSKRSWKIAATLWVAAFVSSCSLLASRPVQDMSDTAAAIRAAREVQADVLAPELYRQATESFFKAKRHYKFKNFKQAQETAEQARLFAEQAEFEAIRSGANRSEKSGADPYAELPAAPAPSGPGAGNGAATATPSGKSEPYPYPTPEPVPATNFDQAPGTPPGTPPPGTPPGPPPGTEPGTAPPG